MERYERWDIVPEVLTPCAQVDIRYDREHSARLRFGLMRDNPDRDLLITFDHVFALMSHEEFAHPWNKVTDGDVPRLTGKWQQYSYPLLIVHDSRWLASFTDSQILDFQREQARHYRLCSLDNTVDFLVAGSTKADWVSGTT